MDNICITFKTVCGKQYSTEKRRGKLSSVFSVQESASSLKAIGGSAETEKTEEAHYILLSMENPLL